MTQDKGPRGYRGPFSVWSAAKRSVAEIEDAAPLFGEGLGLDSVDALELAIEIERTFNITIPDDEDNRKIFRSVDTLATFISANRTAAQAK